MSLSRSDFVPPLVVRLKAWLLRDLFRKGSTGLNKLDLRPSRQLLHDQAAFLLSWVPMMEYDSLILISSRKSLDGRDSD